MVFVLSTPGQTPRRLRAALVLALSLVVVHPPVTPAVVDPFADDAADGPTAAFPDPLERANRQTFRLNRQLDRFIFNPVTHAYAFVVPAPLRRAVRRVLANLAAPTVFVNDVLQLVPTDAAITAGRFAINSTAGIGGIFDVASEVGLAEHFSDFGQTLALYGIPSGPYLIVPAVGPTTARDAVGYVVDLAFRPATYFLGPGATLLVVTGVQESSEGITMREAYQDELHALEASSMDFYAAMRSAYSQERTAFIWTRRQDRGPGALARRLSGSVAGAVTRSERRDPAPHEGGERREALALEY